MTNTVTYSYSLFNYKGEWDNGTWFDTLEEAVEAAECAFDILSKETNFASGWNVYKSTEDELILVESYEKK